MQKNSFLSAIFSGPKFSLAPIEHNNRGSLRIGDVIPVFATVLNPREGIELDMARLVRFMPAKAPVMEGYEVTFDAFAIPYSTLGYAERKERDIDDFFNIKENGGEISNPFCFPMSGLGNILRNPYATSPDDMVSLSAGFLNGTVCDYLNWPSLKSVKEHVRKWLAINPLVHGNNIADFISFTNGDNPFSAEYRAAAEFVVLASLNHRSFNAFVTSTEGDSIELDYSGTDAGTVSFRLGVPFSTKSNPIIINGSSAEDSDLFASSGASFDPDEAQLIAFDNCYSLLGYILVNYPLVSSYYGINPHDSTFSSSNAELLFKGFINELTVRLINNSDSDGSFTLDYLQVLYDNYKIDAQSIYDEYYGYVLSKVLYNSSLVNFEGDSLYEVSGDRADGTFLPMLPDDEPIDLSFNAAYWKCISDWYINTNIDGDPDGFFIEHCQILSDSEAAGRPTNYVDTVPFKRRWANDIFTSSVPQALVQNIRIPADGTIPDLRDANAFQKLVDIFRNTGNRLRDVVYGVFGITPSAVRSEMSEPIGSLSGWIGLQSILQTSQTTSDSPQAAYAGIGTDSDGYKRILKYVNNSEPTPVIVMVLMSVTQRASYMQGFDRKFFRSSIYDFAIPELSMVGEQAVSNKEIYFDKNYDSGIFGFNRRYYDWFYMGSEVHSDLRDSLDYWHGARIFDEQPALNGEFIGIEAATDHLQRVFANVSESSYPIIFNLSFKGYKTVALPRYIQYEL